ncbi:hypothetical protein GGR56DRAFT_671069 [Xylariaceae sp. FL0804]|nr:hypothetical protein GGR56DRAFT_671069 [Xylariaceae sp. FL0804]
MPHSYDFPGSIDGALPKLATLALLNSEMHVEDGASASTSSPAGTSSAAAAGPDPTTAPDLSTARAPRRPRPSKYQDGAPSSAYGPPFVTRPITAAMDPEAVQAAAAHNDAVARARADHQRWKNNQAAQRSRQRRQQLLDSLSREVRDLRAANDRLTREARALAGSAEEASRLRTDNAHLRAVNDILDRRARGLEEVLRRRDQQDAERERVQQDGLLQWQQQVQLQHQQMQQQQQMQQLMQPMQQLQLQQQQTEDLALPPLAQEEDMGVVVSAEEAGAADPTLASELDGFDWDML